MIFNGIKTFYNTSPQQKKNPTDKKSICRVYFQKVFLTR